ncbi:hypothetical protein ABW19_dt0201992 [Dactylella cylindrospora]|nr:hypothetical protein ABW19_dt0201992 [Dactylella cylindrospora]
MGKKSGKETCFRIRRRRSLSGFAFDSCTMFIAMVGRLGVVDLGKKPVGTPKHDMQLGYFICEKFLSIGIPGVRNPCLLLVILAIAACRVSKRDMSNLAANIDIRSRRSIVWYLRRYLCL